MNKDYVVYATSTGEILRTGGFTGDNPSYKAQSGEAAIQGEGRDDTHWVDVSGPTIMEKTELFLTPDKSSIAADGVDAATITVPDGVAVSLNGGEPVDVSDQEVVFKTLDAGDHSLVFTGIPYLPQEVIIGAV